ncbi:MAG: type I DNA topoisomerase [Bacteroidota bacterium]|nr:type I DNA topoisomerase [Bacteroidota bacterium]
MSKNLVIVESPAKAKTIEKFLGSDFKVVSSNGHIADLPSNELGIDLENNYSPKYKISTDKKDLVKKLKNQLKNVETVWLASDEDREGEAIAWHLAENLNLDESKTKRIVFREITENAIRSAIENPRVINKSLVDAQQARRVLDRLVGYKISPILWRKVKGGLSAGRVQSVALRLVAEREKEILNFVPESYFKTLGQFSKSDNSIFNAKYSKNIDEDEKFNEFLEGFINAKFTVQTVEKKPISRKPSAPFTTSTLQQEASRKLGFNVARTMQAAQKLYEAGHITYMRTDSNNLSEFATKSIAEVISMNYGNQYSKTRIYSTKSKNAQQAHEAVRPTNFSNKVLNLDSDQTNLYDLIWKRTVASQMSDAILDKTIVKINSNNHDGIFQSEGEVIKFDGFLKLYQETKDNIVLDESKNNILPDFDEGEEINKIKISVTQSFSKAPFRFSEATLVKKMEELGIGRPSTYAPTISTVMNRKYVFKGTNNAKTRQIVQYNISDEIIKETKIENFGSNKGKLVPSEVGILVNEFLTNNFKNIIDYNFTANVENEFDSIANGSKDWKSIINKFYEPFSLVIEDVQKNAKRETGERILGTDPKTGRQLSVKLGKYGPIAQIGKVDDEEKPLFASLLPEQQISTISVEDALKLFELPVYVGDYENEKVEANIGRYGPYIRHNKIFIPIPEGFNPFTITLDKSIELIEAKKAAQKPIITYKSHDVTKGRGRFGPYLKWNDTFINVNNKYDFDNLTEQDCIELIEEKIKKDKEKILVNWESDQITIEKGRWGKIYLIKGKKRVPLAKNVDPLKISISDAKDILKIKK